MSTCMRAWTVTKKPMYTSPSLHKMEKNTEPTNMDTNSCFCLHYVCIRIQIKPFSLAFLCPVNRGGYISATFSLSFSPDVQAGLIKVF